MPELTADCARCAALCCRLSSFDASDDFAFSKRSGEVCRHLRGDACGVHSRRLELGLPGCVAFDCHGAGQRLTSMLTGQESLDVQVAAFHALIDVHFCLRLVELAERLGVDASVTKADLLASSSSADQLAVLDRDALISRTRDQLFPQRSSPGAASPAPRSRRPGK